MNKKVMFFLTLPAIMFGVQGFAETTDNTRMVRFVQDDAQDYMVSKLFPLKYVQANDVAPFLLGIIMRYNMNSSVGPIVTADNSQILAVTCPIELMPYVDDFIVKVDRDIKISGRDSNSVITGTGITRAVYQPKYRSGQNLLNVLVDSVIGEGPWSSVYAWDANSNQIYWKDNVSNSEYVYQFLGYIDRPSPQITLNFTIYETRESTLRDIGLDYLAWKNGPGLNMFEIGYQAFSVTSAGTAALQAMSGPAGGFLFAPQFDASFIRLLQQNGKAEVKNSTSLTVTNSDSESYEIYFNPEFQNIVKSNNDQTSVGVSSLGVSSGYNQVYLQVSEPIVNIHYGDPMNNYPTSEAFSVGNYAPGEYAKYNGTLYFGYDIETANVVERNNLGTEVIETNTIKSNLVIPLNQEQIIARWDQQQEVEQTIGVPWLVDIPFLGHLFGTTTTSNETIKVYMTVTAEILDTSKPDGMEVGELLDIKSKAKSAKNSTQASK